MKVLSCSICGKPIEDTSRSKVAIQVVGWALPRSGGGVHALALKRETGAYAHVLCVKLEREPQGGSLF